MNNEEHQWEIDQVRNRYDYLNLTIEQAGQVHQYENENQVYAEKHFFSEWESKDYELWIFQHFLTEEQLVKYEKRSDENIQDRSMRRAEADSNYIPQIDHNRKLFELYEVQFWSPFFKDPFLFKTVSMFYEEKIKYLKASYKSFLRETRKEILTQHFRHNRSYAPHQLKNELVRHRLSYILPDIGGFKRNADAPTLGMAHYLTDKLKQLPENVESFMNRSFSAIQLLAEQLMKKYFSDYPRGWHVITPTLTEEEQKKDRILLWLLMDFNKYDLKALYPC